MTPGRHREIVRLVCHARASGLTFIPSTAEHVEYADRVWDLADWMPGAADFHSNPTVGRLRAACIALARLHESWSEFAQPHRPCPAVTRRVDASNEWIGMPVNSTPTFLPPDPVAPWAARAQEIVEQHIPSVPRLLDAWRSVPLPVQPCICDLWHDHVLYTCDDVTGIIDFGAVKMDNVAVDLARLLGSLVGDDVGQFDAGLTAYAEIRPLSEMERALVPILDQTGVVLGLANWLRRLFHQGGEYDDRTAIGRRMAELVRRAESWAGARETPRNGPWGLAQSH
jgi:homoserine kinase type II